MLAKFVAVNKKIFLKKAKDAYNNHKQFIIECIEKHNCPNVFEEMQNPNMILTNTKFFQWWNNRKRCAENFNKDKIKKINALTAEVKKKYIAKSPKQNLKKTEVKDQYTIKFEQQVNTTKEVLLNADTKIAKPLAEELKEVNEQIANCTNENEKQTLIQKANHIKFLIKQEYVMQKIKNYGQDVSYSILKNFHKIEEVKAIELKKIKEIKADLNQLKKDMQNIENFDSDKIMGLCKTADFLLKINCQELKILEHESKIRNAPIEKIKNLINTVALMNASNKEIQEVSFSENQNPLLDSNNQKLDSLIENVKNKISINKLN